MSIDFDSILVLQNPDIKEIETIVVPDGGLSRVGSGNWSPPEDSNGGDNTDGGGSGGDENDGGGGGGVICPDNPECGAHDCATYSELFDANSATIDFLMADTSGELLDTAVDPSDGRAYLTNFFGGPSKITKTAFSNQGIETNYPTNTDPNFCQPRAFCAGVKTNTPSFFYFDDIESLTNLYEFYTWGTGDLPPIADPSENVSGLCEPGTRTVKGAFGIYIDFHNPTSPGANRALKIRLSNAVPAFELESGAVARTPLGEWALTVNPETGDWSFRIGDVQSLITAEGLNPLSGNLGLSTEAENTRRMTGWYHFLWNASYQITSEDKLGKTNISVTCITPFGRKTTGGRTQDVVTQATSSNRCAGVNSTNSYAPCILLDNFDSNKGHYVLARHIGEPNAETRAFARLHENYQAPDYCTEIPTV